MSPGLTHIFTDSFNIYFPMENINYVVLRTSHFIMWLCLYKFDVQYDYNSHTCWYLYIQYVIDITVNGYIHWPNIYPDTTLTIPEYNTLVNTDDTTRIKNIHKANLYTIQNAYTNFHCHYSCRTSCGKSSFLSPCPKNQYIRSNIYRAMSVWPKTGVQGN